jgi:hypothetical protein
VPVASVPMTIEIEPAGALEAWLAATLERVRG